MSELFTYHHLYKNTVLYIFNTTTKIYNTDKQYIKI